MKLQDHLSGLDEDLAKLIILLSEQGKKIKSAFIGRQTYADSKNIYGEQQVALDKWADELLIKELKASGLVKAIASEEQPEVVTVPESAGMYSITLDPLDGSSLIGVNLAVGTIVGIFQADTFQHNITAGTDGKWPGSSKVVLGSQLDRLSVLGGKGA